MTFEKIEKQVGLSASSHPSYNFNYQATPIEVPAGAGTQRVFQPIQQGIHEFPADIKLPGRGLCRVLIVPVKLSQKSHQGHHLMGHAVTIHRIPQIALGVQKKGLEIFRLESSIIDAVQ